MPKYAEAVMHAPAMMTSAHSAAVLPPSSSFATGMANMAMPTPNQPICVKEIIARGQIRALAAEGLAREQIKAHAGLRADVAEQAVYRLR